MKLFSLVNIILSSKILLANKISRISEADAIIFTLILIGLCNHKTSKDN
jgi:predicted RNA-binding protein with PUA domain